MAVLDIPRGFGSMCWKCLVIGGVCVTVNLSSCRFKDAFGEKVHAAKPYSLNNEFCKELASAMVRSHNYFTPELIHNSIVLQQSHSESKLSHMSIGGHVQLDRIAIRDLGMYPCSSRSGQTGQRKPCKGKCCHSRVLH